MGLFLWATSLQETPRWQLTQPLAGRGRLCRALGSACPAHQPWCPRRQLVLGCAGRGREGCRAAGVRSLPVPFPSRQPRLTGSCSAHRSRRCAGWARGRTRRSPAQLLRREQRCRWVRGPVALSTLLLGALLAPTSPGLSKWLVGTGHAPSQGQLVQEPRALQPCSHSPLLYGLIPGADPVPDTAVLPLMSGTTPYSVQSVDSTMAAKWAPAECPHR